MSIVQALVLGIVQGISEFLPISSSGHLILVPVLFGWDVQSQLFDIMVHVATLLAVVVFFRKKLGRIVSSVVRYHTPSPDRTLGIGLIMATIPAALIGFFFGDIIENAVRLPEYVAVSLIIGAVVLWTADWYNATRVSHPREVADIKISHAVVVGMAQVIAFIPGMSRSGMTIAAGLFQKFSKTAAAEFSFLMSIPVIALAGASAFRDFMHGGVGEALPVSVLVVGFVSAALSGLVSIWLTLAIVKKLSFMPFVVYRIIIGLVILFLFV